MKGELVKITTALVWLVWLRSVTTDTKVINILDDIIPKLKRLIDANNKE